MELKRVKINGFKNIKNTIINFNNSGIVGIIALNNYGKSNLLQGIEFAEAFIKASSKTKSNMMKYREAIPINIHLATDNFEFELDFSSVLDNRNVDIKYSYSFSWIKGKENKNKGERIIEESLWVKDSALKKRYTIYINRNQRSSFYKSSKSARCSTEIVIPKDELIINKLKYFDNLFFHDIVTQINDIRFNITSLLNVERAFNVIDISTPILSENEFDQNEGFNISKYLFYLKSREKDKYDLLINSIKSLIPNIETIDAIERNLKNDSELIDKKEIPFLLPEKIHNTRIKEANNNQSTSINQVSCGTKRIILILASAIYAESHKVKLLAFEELENSIHPYLLQKLLIILEALVPNCKILITSHSPYLIQYLDLKNIYIGIPNNDGIAYFRKIQKTKHKKLEELANDENKSLGDFLFDMLIESITTENNLNEYIQEPAYLEI
jgi:predicted ATP-dependent endonuclease of OLD family